MFCFAFWNLENLFAPENFPKREPRIASAINSSLRGWSEALFAQKIQQLSKVILAMNNARGPDVLGVCEVENRFVLETLVEVLNAASGRVYDIVHADAEADKRGIDTAFIFDSQVFSIVPNSIFSHIVIRRTGTRDITQVTFRSNSAGKDIVALANHWPSRSGSSVEETAGFRAVAGETLAYWHMRIREELGDDIAIIAMGDFNDDPWNASIQRNANAVREQGDVERSRSAKFYNLAWQYLGKQCEDHRGELRNIDGSLYYSGNGNVFDQLLVNRSLLKGEGDYVVDVPSADIFTFSEMVDHRVGNGPRRFGLPDGNVEKNIDETGFSDHFPVSVMLDSVNN